MDTQLLDRLWNEYWLHTLSNSPLLSNKATICQSLINVVQKLKAINFMESIQNRQGGYRTQRAGGGQGRAEKGKLKKAIKDLASI